MPAPRVPIADRIWQYIDTEGPCWEWIGGRTGDGYGAVWLNGKTVPAHRVVWELLVAAIPSGLVADHRCYNRACVNPDHLEMTTYSVNNFRRRTNFGRRGRG